MITFAIPSDLPALRALWRECFGDPEAYIDFYFQNRFRCDQTLVWREGGAPVAMLSLLPVSVICGGTACPARYIYAVATGNAWRGRGLSTRLMEHARLLLQERDEGLTVLVAAEPALFDFYAKRGYTQAASLKTAHFPVQRYSDGGYAFSEGLSAAEYKALRDARFAREGYLCWDEAAIGYALRENAFTGGFACAASLPDGGRAAVVGQRRDKLLWVRETTLPDEAVEPALCELARRMGCGEVEVRLPADSAVEGAVRPFGMAGAPLGGGGYFNLVLD